MNNSEIIKETKSILKGNYNKVIVPFFLFAIISGVLQNQDIISSIYSDYGVFSGAVYSVLVLVVGSVIAVGLASFSLSIIEGQIDINKLKDGLSIVNKAFIFYVLYIVIVVLGFICLIVPGIIFSLMFSQVYYILCKDPEIGVIDAFKKSAAMMNGHKWQYFKLSLRYGFYFFLSIFTLFIWALWLFPQMYTSYALFHKKVSES
mgnify:FL=1|tara:strand:- start:207 stop:818 length:612 start_codon:yes stop_codon:yes gene_type:complete